MGIDRIGKGAPPAGEGGERVDEATGPEKPFAAVGADKAVPPTAAAEASAASPLGRLRAGEIDVDGYVDLKVDEATRGLAGLSRAELDDIRKLLKDQLATDPGLTDLVESATGRVPTPPDE